MRGGQIHRKEPCPLKEKSRPPRTFISLTEVDRKGLARLKKVELNGVFFGVKPPKTKAASSRGAQKNSQNNKVLFFFHRFSFINLIVLTAFLAVAAFVKASPAREAPVPYRIAVADVRSSGSRAAETGFRLHAAVVKAIRRNPLFEEVPAAEIRQRTGFIPADAPPERILRLCADRVEADLFLLASGSAAPYEEDAAEVRAEAWVRAYNPDRDLVFETTVQGAATRGKGDGRDAVFLEEMAVEVMAEEVLSEIVTRFTRYGRTSGPPKEGKIRVDKAGLENGLPAGSLLAVVKDGEVAGYLDVDLESRSHYEGAFRTVRNTILWEGVPAVLVRRGAERETVPPAVGNMANEKRENEKPTKVSPAVGDMTRGDEGQVGKEKGEKKANRLVRNVILWAAAAGVVAGAVERSD